MWCQSGVLVLASLNYNYFPVKGKIPWVVELESTFEVVEKLP